MIYDYSSLIINDGILKELSDEIDLMQKGSAKFIFYKKILEDFNKQKCIICGSINHSWSFGEWKHNDF